MNEILVIELSLDGQYNGQIGYEYCPLFPIDNNRLKAFIEEKKPELKGKKYEKEVITNVSVGEYKKFKIYRRKP